MVLLDPRGGTSVLMSKLRGGGTGCPPEGDTLEVNDVVLVFFPLRRQTADFSFRVSGRHADQTRGGAVLQQPGAPRLPVRPRGLRCPGDQLSYVMRA